MTLIETRRLLLCSVAEKEAEAYSMNRIDECAFGIDAIEKRIPTALPR